MKRYFLLWMLFLGLYAARGQEGSLDASFAGTGWAPLNFATSGNAYNDYGRQLMVQSDGKYIVLVQSSSYYYMLARYTADGVLDKSFGNSGFTYPIDLGYDIAALVLADDQIVVGGSRYDYTTGKTNLALKRYTRNGVLDAGFGSGGVAIAEFPSYATTLAHGLAVQSSGDIIAVGRGLDNNNDNHAFVVARFTGTGVLDYTFNSGGMLALDYSTYLATAARAVALQGDHIIVAGEGVDPATGQLAFTLVRLTATGTVDASFGTDGWVRTSFASNAYLTALALQPDQRIVAGGYSYNTTTQNNDFALARYTPEGGLEGTGTTDPGAEDRAYGLVLDNGKIVLVGFRETYGPDYHKDIVLVRYTGSGAPDESFDGDGIVITSLEGDDEAYGVVLLADGRLLVSGNSFTTSSNTADVLLARYHNDGTLDNTFNAADAAPGVSFSYYSHGIQAEISDMVVQPDGKLVVAGVSAKEIYSWYSNNIGVARFNPDGTLDASFGNGGVVAVDFGNSAGASSVALQPDGKIVVGGSVGYDNAGWWESDFALARLTREGVLDPTFDGDGKATIYLYSADYLVDIAVLPDGKIIGAGASYEDRNPEGGYNSSDFAVVRFTPDGKLDRRFGNDGLVTTDFFGDYDHTGSVAVQPDGRILVSGVIYKLDPGNPDNYLSEFAVVRYNSNGVLDTRFGTGGKALTTMGTAWGGGLLALQGDGKILVGGTVEQDPVNYTSDFALVRFTGAGVPDTSFGGDGVVTTDFGGVSEYAGPVVLQSDGKILLVGGYYDGAGSYFAVVRYLNDGTHDGELDASFDGDGKAVTSFPGADLGAAAAWHHDRVYFSGHWQMPDLAAAELPPSFFESSFVAALQASSATPPLPVVSIADVSVAEGQEAELTITLSRAAPAAITVNYATQDGTAASKGKRSDYKSARSFVTIEAGVPSAAIRIPTTLNGPGDDGQYFYVNLSLGVKMTGLAVLGDDQAKVTIEEGGLLVGPLANKAAPAEPVAGTLAATAYPNPSSGHFTLQLQSGNTAPVAIRVTDAAGRVVEAKTGVAANGTLQLGSNYRPGVYYVHLQQGTEKQTLKLVKGTQ